MTYQANDPLRLACLLQQTFFALSETIAAKLLLGLKNAHSYLLQLGEDASSNFDSLIFLRLSVPVFHAHNFIFKVLISLYQRRILHLGRGSTGIDLNKRLLKLYKKSLLSG